MGHAGSSPATAAIMALPLSHNLPWTRGPPWAFTSIPELGIQGFI